MYIRYNKKPHLFAGHVLDKPNWRHLLLDPALFLELCVKINKYRYSVNSNIVSLIQ